MEKFKKEKVVMMAAVWGDTKVQTVKGNRDGETSNPSMQTFSLVLMSQHPVHSLLLPEAQYDSDCTECRKKTVSRERVDP